MPAPYQSHIAVIGAGPAGLMAAEVLAHGGARVTVYDAMPSPGRKFLLAGRGGLNLTHSENLQRLLTRYGAAEHRLRPAIEAFPPSALRAWCEALGQETFVGTSGRVFPKAMKASPLLRAWLRRLDAAGVAFRLRHRWTGWDAAAGSLTFASPSGPATAAADATVLALGGASWPQLGSTGAWADVLAAAFEARARDERFASRLVGAERQSEPLQGCAGETVAEDVGPAREKAAIRGTQGRNAHAGDGCR